jgi:uncharacterized membrane protein
MTDQRYAPPLAPLAEPRLRQAGGQIDLGAAFREAWAALWPNLGLLIGAGIVGALVSIAAVCTIVGIFLVLPVLAWGWWRLQLNVLDGTGEVKDQFAGFGSYGANLSGMMGLGSLMLMIGLAGQSLQYLGQLLGSLPLMMVGVAASFAWSVIVLPRLAFVWYFLVDQGLTPSEAVRACWDATTGQRLMCLLVGLVSWLTILVGFLCLIVGVIPGALLASLMHAAVYRQLAGR